MGGRNYTPSTASTRQRPVARTAGRGPRAQAAARVVAGRRGLTAGERARSNAAFARYKNRA